MEDKKEIWTAQKIQNILNFQYICNPQYLINNLYVFDWESDYLAMTRSGYFYEVEIKISKSDFKADFLKKEKHALISNTFNMHDIPHDGKYYKSTTAPNYFSYCVPEGLIDIRDIPPYAGLLEIDRRHQIRCVRKPPKLHDNKILKSLESTLMNKFYYNYRSMLFERNDQLWNYKKRINELELEIKELKEKLKEK